MSAHLSRQTVGDVMTKTVRTGARLLAGTPDGGGLDEHLRRFGPLPSAGETLIEAVSRAGLTGRGGAAFPTGRKMRAVAEHVRGRRRAVVVANGMESEPASRKDHTLLALAPHLVLDGAALAAAAVGADRVHLCVPRGSDLIRPLTAAVAERRAEGVDPLAVQIQALPHGYVTSEASALVRWLNGGDARPLRRPPHPRQRGVRDRPTLVQNVETLAHIALIARYGPEWFRACGTEDSPGTALVTVSGAVRQPGVREIAFGVTVGDLLASVGGASEPPRALLIGGFAGSWVPAGNAVDLSFSIGGLAAAGASPGAGVVVVLPQDACGLAETARILGYLAANGAQQCGPCRLGLPAVAADFAAIAEGHLHPGLLPRLHERIDLLVGRGACRHPDGAARLAASALTAFHTDLARHLRGRPCQLPTRLAVPAIRPIEQWR